MGNLTISEKSEKDLHNTTERETKDLQAGLFRTVSVGRQVLFTKKENARIFYLWITQIPS